MIPPEQRPTLYPASIPFSLPEAFMRELWDNVRHGGVLSTWADLLSVPTPYRFALWIKETVTAEERPPEVYVDLPTLLRGLIKCFDCKYEMDVEVRSRILMGVVLADAVWITDDPDCLDVIVQLALYDQVIYQ